MKEIRGHGGYNCCFYVGSSEIQGQIIVMFCSESKEQYFACKVLLRIKGTELLLKSFAPNQRCRTFGGKFCSESKVQNFIGKLCSESKVQKLSC